MIAAARHQGDQQADDMRRIHLVVGAVTLAAFLASGIYMRSMDRPEDLGRLVMFTSRHIYILSAALINLLLGAYVTPAATGRARMSQRLGSLLLIVAVALLVVAFAAEPVAGRPRTAVSSFGLYALFAGSLLHVVARVVAPAAAAVPERSTSLERN